MKVNLSEYTDKVVSYVKEHPVKAAGAACLVAVSYAALFPGKKASELDEPDCANFNAWMKTEPVAKPAADEPEFDSANFNTFLKPAGAPSAAKAAPAAPKASKSKTSTGMVVLYGTEYGFSKEIAEKLTKKLNSQGLHPRLLNMADFPSGLDLTREKAVLMCCSTQGDGVPPNEAREFVDWLDTPAPGKLDGTPFSVLALGDLSYEHFCACGKRLDARLESLGGNRVFPRYDINKEDWARVDEWIEGVCNKVTELGIRTEAPPAALNDVTNGVLNGHTNGDVVAKKKYSRSNPYLATVTRVQGLCHVASKDDKDTVQVEFDLGDSGLEYLPGDALGVVPRNCTQKVAELLKVWGADGTAEVPLPSWKGQVNASVAAAETLPLRAALVSCYDIRQPKPEIFAALKQAYDRLTAAGNQLTAEGMKQAEQLRALADDAKARDEFLSTRHLVDVLAAFPAARLSVAEVLPCLRQLQARLYSISSSQRENKGRVQITVAVVRYEQHGLDRIGVCSTFVGERMEVGSQVPIFVSKNPDFRLPKAPATPIIMVGPGTGLAPFRSFMMDRILSGAPYGESVLFFGCRRSDQDFLYGPTLEGWHREGKLRLFTAFSREGKQKVYVQQRIREQGDLLFSLLEKGAHFYVCGDASSMAGQVEEALLGLIKERVPGKTEAEALAYLDHLRKTERYQRDVWY